MCIAQCETKNVYHKHTERMLTWYLLYLENLPRRMFSTSLWKVSSCLCLVDQVPLCVVQWVRACPFTFRVTSGEQ